MQTTNYKLVELFIIFVLIPISFVIHYPIWIKLIIGVLGFAYVIFILLRVEKNQFKINKNINWKLFLRRAFTHLIIIAFFTSIYVYLIDRPNFYAVVLNKPLLWLIVLFVYSAFSVYPQELIYRTFFFQRYQSLFKIDKLFILLNASLFSLAHLFFRNGLVMIVTFVGGIIFALTFKRTRSTLLVSIEHAIYGSWLFTVGMGSMLGFPS